MVLRRRPQRLPFDRDYVDLAGSAETPRGRKWEAGRSEVHGDRLGIERDVERLVVARSDRGGEVLRDARAFDQQGSRRFLRLDLDELLDGTFDDHHAGQLVRIAGQGEVLLVAVDAAFLRKLVEVSERLAEDLEALCFAPRDVATPRNDECS